MKPETSDLSSQTSYMNILESALDADEPPQRSKAPKIPYKLADMAGNAELMSRNELDYHLGPPSVQKGS